MQPVTCGMFTFIIDVCPIFVHYLSHICPFWMALYTSIFRLLCSIYISAPFLSLQMACFASYYEPLHCGTKPGRFETSNDSLSHRLGSEWVGQWASERMSAVERPSKASSAVQADEWEVRVNEWTNEWVAHNLCLNSWLFWTTVLLRAPVFLLQGTSGGIFEGNCFFWLFFHLLFLAHSLKMGIGTSRAFYAIVFKRRTCLPIHPFKRMNK